MYVNATFSICPTFSLHYCVRKSVVYISVSIPAADSFISTIFLDSMGDAY